MIPTSGFYEWLKEGKDKQPFIFRLKTDKVFGFAGLYETWQSPDGDIVPSCTIITTQPHSLCAKVHDRMPVILDEEGVATWLDPDIT